MKIAFLHMTMGLVNRGSEVTIDLLCNQLSKRHEVLCLQAGPVSIKKYTQKRVWTLKEAPSPSPKNIWEKILFRLRLDKESEAVTKFTLAASSSLKQFNPDIIVAVNGSLQVNIVKILGLPAKVVCFGHAGIGHHDYLTLKSAPDLFIALSQPAYDWADRYKHAGTKVKYIPNPLSTPQKVTKLKLNLPSPVVLVVGALTKYKNIISTVEAVKETGYSLLIIGDGEQAGDLEKALSDFGGEFRWIKQVEPGEMASYYASSDVFCFVPDPQEAFGRVYLEAMAAGLPIVASDDPIRRELIGVQGFYANPNDHAQIKNQIIAAANSAKIDYSKELKPYNLDNIIKQIESEFHELTR